VKPIGKSTNVFGADGGVTGGFSVFILQRLLARSKSTTQTLYMCLLTRATGPTFLAHTGELLEETGLSRQTFLNARDELLNPKGLNLIRCTETTKQGVWRYELLNERGGKLATYGEWVVFNELPTESIKAYYCYRLDVATCDEDTQGNLRFNCPFHSMTKSKPTLQVTIAPGDGLHGRFICGDGKRCGRRGGLIDFELAMAAKSGEQLTDKQAGHQVRVFMASMVNADLPNPALQVPDWEQDEETISV